MTRPSVHARLLYPSRPNATEATDVPECAQTVSLEAAGIRPATYMDGHDEMPAEALPERQRYDDEIDHAGLDEAAPAQCLG